MILTLFRKIFCLFIGLLSIMSMTIHARVHRNLLRMVSEPRAEWKLWMPGSKKHEVKNNLNHWGSSTEWKRWVHISQKRWSSGGGADLSDDEGSESDEWKSFQFGTFQSQMGPTKKQIAQAERLKRMAPPTEIDPLWNQLTDEEVLQGIEAVRQYVTADRQAKFSKVLASRTDFVRLVFENPVNVNNCWAALRTFDSFGIQFTEVIAEEASYHTSWRRDTMVQALGAQKWLSLRQEGDSASCLQRLKSQGYRIAASDLNPSAVSLYDVDFTAQKTVIVLGNEKSGISEAVRGEADVLFYLPMKGFAESLNVSAFCAVLCGVLQNQGALDPALSQMTPGAKNRILLTWLSRTAPGSLETMRRAGLDMDRVGNKIWDTVGSFSTKP